MEKPQDIDAYEPKYLVTTRGDYVYATGLGTLAFILSVIFPPLGIAAGLVGANRLSPMMKRLDMWMANLKDTVAELQAQGMTIEELASNEQFVTAVLQASDAALRTHQKEKLEALRNALLNVGLGTQADENKQLVFLSLIDELTADHIKLLKYLDDPRTFLRQKSIDYANQSPTQLLAFAFPELKGQEAYAQMLVATMYSRGLLAGDWPHAADLNEVAATTPPAKEFLAFIKSPPEPDASSNPTNSAH